MPTRLALQVRGHKAGRMKHRTPCRGQKEHQVSVFTVDLKNQPGELARLCEAMAGRGIARVWGPFRHRSQRHPVPPPVCFACPLNGRPRQYVHSGNHKRA